MRIRISKGREIYNFCPPYVIAELAANHNGDMRLAGAMIKKAKEAGADCVKFQTWTKVSIFSKIVYKENRFLSDDYRKRKDYTLEKIVEEFSISESELLDMKRIAEGLGLDCIATPFSKPEVDFLVHVLKVPYIKIASMDVNNYPFLRYVAGKNLPLVISTGLSSLDEIKKAISTIEEAGNKNIIILHCVAKYPPEDNEANLNRIDTLRSIFPYPIGFSDHSLGYSMALAAVAKGACIIEKHFTLDKNMFGWDHKVSADAEELKIIVRESKRIQVALGDSQIKAVEDPERIRTFRRSIVAKRKIKKNEIATEDMFDFKRPGSGFAPEAINSILGKIAKRNINRDDLIRVGDF